MEVLEHILAENCRIADANRSDLWAAGVRTVNLMSAPGAGKTTLLRRTIASLGEQVRIGVLEGDIATSLDADALSGLGAQVSLVNTSAGFGGECHLDATMVRSGLPGSNSTASTCWSSRTSATSCAPPSSTSARTPGRWCTP